MLTILQAVASYLVKLGRDIVDGWNRFWFQPVDPIPLAFVRLLTGFLVFYVYASTFGETLNLIGPEGWIDRQAIEEIRTLHQEMELPFDRQSNRFYAQSIWFYVQHPWAILVIQGLFLLAALCYAVGLFSRVSNLLVWIGHLSFVHRGYMAWFGMDSVLSMLLLYQLIGPTGATLSVDRLIERYRLARRALSAHGRISPEDLALKPSWTANLSLRMIQLHMGVIYLFAGLAKLQGDRWWYGSAAWYTMVVPELELFSMRWLANTPPWLYVTLVFAATYYTLIFEISFIFLVWNRTLRPLMLLGAVALHVGIGLFMGLMEFGVAMLTGCAAFLTPEGLRWFFSALFAGKDKLRMAYDRRDPKALRAVALTAAADAFGQVTFSPTAERHLEVTSGDGKVLTGSAAFHRLLSAVRCFPLVALASWGAFSAGPSEVVAQMPGRT